MSQKVNMTFSFAKFVIKYFFNARYKKKVKSGSKEKLEGPKVNGKYPRPSTKVW